MAKISLKFTEEQIKVIRCLRFRKLKVKHERKDIIGKIKEISALVDGIDPGDEYDGIDAEKEAVHGMCDMIHSELNDIYQSAVRSQQIAIEDEDKYYGFDLFELFNGTHPYNVVALILGEQDKVIAGSEEQYGRPKYPDELEQKFDEILGDIFVDIVHIEDLLHQRCNLGGIQAGVKYVAIDHEGIWRTEEEFEEEKMKKKAKRKKDEQ